MKRFFFAVLIIVLLVMPNFLFAQDQYPYMMQENEILSIDNISVSISQLTGAAISPLLVTGAIGAYKYITAPSKDARKQLPWYFQPWFFIICLLITVPALLSSTTSFVNIDQKITKILDLLNKKIGLLLVTPILFEIISPFFRLVTDNAQTAFTLNNANNLYAYASLFSTDFPVAIPIIIWLFFTAAALVFVFLAIWLLNYIFDIIIFLCPFGFAEAFLKTVRGAYFSLLILFAFIYPPLGLILTLPIIIISVALFGWSIRRAVMGIVFIYDFITKKKDTVIDKSGVIAFSEAGFKMPAKRMGKINQQDGKWFFTFRKFFLFEKTVIIEKTESIFTKGLLFSEIRQNTTLLPANDLPYAHSHAVSIEGIAICSLPPRYQKICTHVQSYLGVEKFEETKLGKGIKAIIAWIKKQFSARESSQSAT